MRRWLIVIGATVVLFVGLLYAFTPAIKTEIRERTEAYLRARFQSDIQFSHFAVSLFPYVRASIDGLTLRLQGRTDVPPLIEIRQVNFTASISGMLQKRFTIRTVELQGLLIHMPPKETGARPRIHGTETDLAKKYPVLIHEIAANNALISILRGDLGKPPREFPIHELVIKDFSFDSPASFHAVLTNPVPKGQIDCAGRFGPWDAVDPRHTPVSAEYIFSHADMGTIKGLAGTLRSTGKFSGPLDYLNVEGQTETPDFALRMSGHSVNLHTDYQAIVDGTNGDVILKPVIAHFRHTTLVVNGEVADLTPEKGRTILLDAVSREATIEDVLYLTVKNDPPVMTGPAALNAKIDIGEGDADLLQRMTIDGQFSVADARFSSSNTQAKIDTLSRKAQGHPTDKDIDDVVSNLLAKFRVDNGVASFSKLSFGVTGANIALTGSYGLNNGEMDFRGHLLMRAKLSQTMTGAKSFFLKAVDPFFKGKNGGSDIPIKITGTRDHPSFGLDLHHGSDDKKD
jgi:hypothetical protein